MISSRKEPNFIANDMKISYVAVQNETDDVVVRRTDDASVQTEPVDVALPAEVNEIAVETHTISTSDMALQTVATELVDVSTRTDSLMFIKFINLASSAALLVLNPNLSFCRKPVRQRRLLHFKQMTLNS